MPNVVVNELTLEPKATPPAETAPGAQQSGGGAAAKGGPELEREIARTGARRHERELRLWAH